MTPKLKFKPRQISNHGRGLANLKKSVIIRLILLLFLISIAGISNVKASGGLVAYWESTGTNNIEIEGSQRIAVNVTNYASAKGSMYLAIESNNSKLAITPLQMTVNNLEPHIPQTVYFSATNLGVEQQINDIPVTIIASDSYTGQENNREVIYATLVQTLETSTPTPTDNIQPLKQNIIDWTFVIVASIIALAIVGAGAMIAKAVKQSR